MTTQYQDTTGGFLGLGNMTKIKANPFKFLLDLARSKGGVAYFKFGPTIEFYLVSEPDYIREILVKQWSKTIKWERLTQAANTVTKYNIVFLEGEIWKSQRKLLTPAFHTQRVQDYLKLIHDHTVRMLNGWGTGQVCDIRETMTSVTMGIICEILFGIKDVERDAARLSHAIDVLVTDFIVDAGSLFVLPKWLPLKRHKQAEQAKTVVLTYLTDLTRQRRKEGVDRGDVLSSLILTQDAETGEALTDQQIGEELYALFVAGHETTALWLSWTLYLLAKHPEIQDRLCAEITAAGIDSMPTMENLHDMPLLDHILKESLRMYPPAWSLFMRRVVEDIQLGEQVIPKGGVIFISPYVQHHLPQYWENPDTFDPSRFEGDWKSERPTYAYMPFGGGPRVCMGGYLAEVEAKVILTTIIQQYSISLLKPDQEVQMDGGFTLRPFPIMELCLEKRG